MRKFWSNLFVCVALFISLQNVSHAEVTRDGKSPVQHRGGEVNCTDEGCFGPIQLYSNFLSDFVVENLSQVLNGLCSFETERRSKIDDIFGPEGTYPKAVVIVIDDAQEISGIHHVFEGVIEKVKSNKVTSFIVAPGNEGRKDRFSGTFSEVFIINNRIAACKDVRCLVEYVVVFAWDNLSMLCTDPNK
ncbi:hypothetical protein M3P21_05735 [Ruegeria sp. 2012CJ41-6]|uniref:Uncharacterized protein n=1 Tax=Ruegeria spongiae TaxID=2942209 RepID=A0ABT0PZH0_9RHOB|nr:hypothetical protein [Ruegeria spongiae]MCL6283030.1 hypothetical protein [Ruegeria spongiae]